MAISEDDCLIYITSTDNITELCDDILEICVVLQNPVLYILQGD